jgi:LacI family gluconate utilization system Gnt-I transcriptional repressor
LPDTGRLIITTDDPTLPAAKPAARQTRRGSGGTTLADVAKLAGVSAITVSRALNSPALVTPATLAKVRRAVERTGYVPNLLAGGLASNRSRLVAALVPTIAGSVFLETVQALTESLTAAGNQLILGQSGYAGTHEDALLDALIGRRPDGIVLTGILRSATGRRRLLASGIPVVETWDLTPTPIDMLVGFSHEQVGMAVARYLYDKGYRRPGLVFADDYRASKRRLGFERALAELGVSLPPASMVTAPSTLGNGRSGLLDLMAIDAKLDVVFCSSDVLAQGVITEAQAQGRRVPDDLAVMGFGDQDFARHLNPALTTVRIDGTAIGRHATAFILERAEGREPDRKILDIGFSIAERASV